MKINYLFLIDNFYTTIALSVDIKIINSHKDTFICIFYDLK